MTPRPLLSTLMSTLSTGAARAAGLRPHDMRGRLVGPMLLGLSAVAGLLLTYAFFVQTRVGQVVDGDKAATQELLSVRTQSRMAHMLDVISPWTLVLALAILVLAALLQRRTRTALAAIVLVGGANLTTQVLKGWLERPALLQAGGYIPDNTLPSGHATVACSLAIALVLVCPPRFRREAALAGLAMSLVVGVAVILSGWHHPSDSVAAALAATAWGALALLIARREAPAWGWDGRGGRTTRESPLARGLVAAGAVLLGLAAVALAVFAADPITAGAAVDPTTGELPSNVTALAGGLLLATGTILLSTGAFLANAGFLDRPNA